MRLTSPLSWDYMHASRDGLPVSPETQHPGATLPVGSGRGSGGDDRSRGRRRGHRLGEVLSREALGPYQGEQQVHPGDRGRAVPLQGVADRVPELVGELAELVDEVAEPAGAGRYSPPHVTHAEKTVIAGSPDPKHISTSLVERQNLTMRMNMRRFTRLTNAFSKKVENLRAAVALHFAHYNFVRIHGSLRVTPAMAAGVSSRLWTMEELVDRTSN